MKHLEIEFTKSGEVFDAAQARWAVEQTDTTDLFVLVHGWNNDMAEARSLYDRWERGLDALLERADITSPGAPLAALAGRSFSALRVFWPSKRFADEDLIPGGGAAAAAEAGDAALTHVLDSLVHDPERLGGDDASPERRASGQVARVAAATLQDAAARRRFVQALRDLIVTDGSVDDDGLTLFLEGDAEELFRAFADPVLLPTAAGTGGATGLGQGGAAGLGDLLSGVGAAARRLANTATYYQMKARAGLVGERGLGPVLTSVILAHPGLRVHLVGHSFGGRLVTAAAHALEAPGQQVTLSLLQAAFSHNALSADFGGGRPGAYRDVLSRPRLGGPVVITHTKNDRAVGIAYPLASRLARQNAAFLGDRNDPYGGMGRNGAQHTTEAVGHASTLEKVGHVYAFESGAVHNLLADALISGHSDVAGDEVLYAILSAASAV